MSPLARMSAFRPVWSSTIVMCVLGVFGVAPMCAQGTVGRTYTVLPAQSPADTGRMTWGRQNFATYDTPNQCDRGVAGLMFQRMRSGVADTVPYTLTGDTLPTTAYVAARACRTPFTIEKTLASGLWSLMRLALAANDDSAAARVFNKIVTLPGDSLTQLRRYSAAVEVYLTAAPPRPVAARAVLGELGALALSSSARRVAYDARVQFIDYWKRTYQPDSAIRDAESAIAIAKTLSGNELNAVDAVGPYYALFDNANDRNDTRAQEEILSAAAVAVEGWRNGLGAGQVLGLRTLLDLRKTAYGKTARPLKGAYWFHQRNTLHPAPGVASLIVYIQPGCHRECYQLYTLLRSLGQQYGDSLDITILSETLGYLPSIGPVAPDWESTTLARYYREFWRIPANVLIDTRTVTRQPDGRVIYQSSGVGKLFNEWRSLNTVLVDKKGTVRWLGSVFTFAQQRQLSAALLNVL